MFLKRVWLTMSIRKGLTPMYNILVCDDERDIVSALKIYLTSGDYRVY